MKRAAFDDSRDSGTRGDYAPDKLNCTVCKKLTQRAELGNYGARCHGCFTGYCNELNRDIGPIATREDKLEVLAWLRDIFATPKGPKAWAHQLREREQAGGELSRLQRRMWRAALPEEVQS